MSLSTREWVTFDRPCWDNYCRYAELMHDFLFTEYPAARTHLLEFMRDDYHANSPLVPVVTASLYALSQFEVVTCFRLVCGMATILAAVCVGWLLHRQGRVERGILLASLLLFAVNIALVRCMFFPQTDAVVLLWVSALLAFVVARHQSHARIHSALCFAVLCTGLFVKLSFLPALALIPLATLFVPGQRRPSERMQAFMKDGLIYALLPLGIYLGFQHGFQLLSNYRTEMHEMQTVDSRAVFHLESLLKISASFVLPLCLAGNPRGFLERLLWIWIGLYGVSLWAAGTSGWGRFYLAVVPALAILSARGLKSMRDEGGEAVLWTYVILAAVLNYAALTLHLYS
jgi:hypothetical protein